VNPAAPHAPRGARSVGTVANMGMGRMGEEDGCVRVPLPANETARVPTLCDRSVDEKAETTFAATAPRRARSRSGRPGDALADRAAIGRPARAPVARFPPAEPARGPTPSPLRAPRLVFAP